MTLIHKQIQNKTHNREAHSKNLYDQWFQLTLYLIYTFFSLLFSILLNIHQIFRDSAGTKIIIFSVFFSSPSSLRLHKVYRSEKQRTDIERAYLC